jgi:hypothetical protein
LGLFFTAFDCIWSFFVDYTINRHTIGCFVSMIYLYVLLAIAITDQPAQQTIRYFDTVGECMEYKNKIEPTD